MRLYRHELLLEISNSVEIDEPAAGNADVPSAQPAENARFLGRIKQSSRRALSVDGTSAFRASATQSQPPAFWVLCPDKRVAPVPQQFPNQLHPDPNELRYSLLIQDRRGQRS